MSRVHDESHVPESAASSTLSRRTVLASAIAAGLGASVVRTAPATQQEAAGGGSSGALPKPFRIAHLTDVHVQPERNAEAGFAACLAHAQAGTRDAEGVTGSAPDLILFGGDHVMDVFEQGNDRASMLARLWRDALRRDCSLPVEPCIGNHDIWGWHSRAKVADADPKFGKAFALELLGLPARYRSFDRAGWHFVILDSIQRRPDGYVAEIDAEQCDWLEKDLAAKPASTPTLVLSHVPILSITPIAGGNSREGDELHIGTNLVHGDGHKLHALLRKSGVKLCLSGHMHLLDRCEADGVTYICDGAVSGNWWKGRHQTLDEGYGIVDIYPDGRFTHEYVTYGWKA